MALIALASGLGFWLVGLEFALPLALFAGVAQSVPTFGPLLTLLLSLVVAATQGLPQVIGVVGVYIVVQSLESYVLTPLVMKRAVNVPPVVTLLTIILWGNVFGLAGLVLAIPIDLTIWAFLRNHIIEARDEGPPATPPPT
jgi:predicted PurR-regulated permease PerM